MDEGLWDQEFVNERTEGFEEWKASLEKYTPDFVESITSVPKEQMIEAARLYASPPFSGSCFVWGMGLTQHTNGTANCHAVLNLALVSGQMGKPGNGISPLRGQNQRPGLRRRRLYTQQPAGIPEL